VNLFFERLASEKMMMEENISFDDKQRKEFLRLAAYRMPFGKYKGRLLIDLPEPYVVWFKQKGFPNGPLGHMLALVYEIKANGLEHLFRRPAEGK